MIFEILGHIANSMVEDLIAKITAVEDIPADLATDLVTLLNNVVQETPTIFPVSNFQGNFPIFRHLFTI